MQRWAHDIPLAVLHPCPRQSSKLGPGHRAAQHCRLKFPQRCRLPLPVVGCILLLPLARNSSVTPLSSKQPSWKASPPRRCFFSCCLASTSSGLVDGAVAPAPWRSWIQTPHCSASSSANQPRSCQSVSSLLKLPFCSLVQPGVAAGPCSGWANKSS